MTDPPSYVEINPETAAFVRNASRADYEPLDEENLSPWAAGIIEYCRSKDKIRLLEPGLSVHYKLEVKDEVRGAINKAFDRGQPDEAPHDLWDPEFQSDCEGYDEYAPFALRRETETSPWTATRFELRTLFELLQPYSHGVRVIALAGPLEGYE